MGNFLNFIKNKKIKNNIENNIENNLKLLIFNLIKKNIKSKDVENHFNNINFNNIDYELVGKYLNINLEFLENYFDSFDLKNTIKHIQMCILKIYDKINLNNKDNLKIFNYFSILLIKK
jgi:hypothetical protein